MRVRDPELIEQPGHSCSQSGRGWLDVRRQGLGVPESRQIDGNDVEVLRKRRKDRIPGLSRQPQGVQEHEGFATASAVIGKV